VRNNSAKRKLAAGKPVSVVAPTYSSPGLVELLGRTGYDMIFIDCEHGPASWDAVEDMVRAAELCDVTPIVRVQSHDHSTITRALDRGAGGVQVPHVNTRAEAEAIVRHSKFSPIGHRGFAGGRAAFGRWIFYCERQRWQRTLDFYYGCRRAGIAVRCGQALAHGGVWKADSGSRPNFATRGNGAEISPAGPSTRLPAQNECLRCLGCRDLGSIHSRSGDVRHQRHRIDAAANG